MFSPQYREIKYFFLRFSWRKHDESNYQNGYYDSCIETVWGVILLMQFLINYFGDLMMLLWKEKTSQIKLPDNLHIDSAIRSL